MKFEMHAAKIAYFSMEIALTGSFFNTHRMLHQYIAHAYLD